MINTIFLDLLDKGVVVFIDDILVYSHGTKEEHTQLLDKVMQRYYEHGIALEVDKCELYKEEVKFLGYLVSRQGVRMTDESISAIRNYEKPGNKHQEKISIA